jgi:hypothetical protein
MLIRPARASALWLLATCAISLPIAGKNLTPFGNQNPLLALLAEPLEKVQVDVRSTYSRPALKTTRPVLTSLSEWPLPEKPEAWPELERDFKEGAFGFMNAVETKPGAVKHSGSLTVGKMRKLWAAAEPSRRLFLSFTRADRDTAENVRQELEKHGFVVFTYIKKTGKPPFTVQEVGRFFREAHHRYVLDTAHARASTGVWIERVVQQQYAVLEGLRVELVGVGEDAARLASRKVGSESTETRSTRAALAANVSQRAAILARLMKDSLDPRDPSLAEVAKLRAEWPAGTNPSGDGTPTQDLTQVERLRLTFTRQFFKGSLPFREIRPPSTDELGSMGNETKPPESGFDMDEAVGAETKKAQEEKRIRKEYGLHKPGGREVKKSGHEGDKKGPRK